MEFIRRFCDRCNADRIGMRRALRVSDRSICDRKHVGCVIIDAFNGNVLAGGWNAIPGCPLSVRHCSQVCARGAGRSHRRDYTDCPAMHAEEIAIAGLMKHLEKTNNMMSHGCSVCIYVTAPPCRACTQRLELLSQVVSIQSIVWDRVDSVDSEVPAVQFSSKINHKERRFSNVQAQRAAVGL